ncbi:xylose isomerase, partial [candidate division KSB1 bacterium]|nr:xylose isomerase [candidate division KSB1 bacterium]
MQSLHSICRWTFNAGKGGFVPGDMRPEWSSKNLSTADSIRLVKDKIYPRLPKHVDLGFEMHYDTEFNEKNADEITEALVETGIYLSIITPGAHSHFAYGGICSLDPNERKAAQEMGERCVDLGYGALKKAWHPQADLAPTLVLWNGSYGYDLATVGIKQMYQHLKENVAKLCPYENKKGG